MTATDWAGAGFTITNAESAVTEIDAALEPDRGPLQVLRSPAVPEPALEAEAG